MAQISVREISRGPSLISQAAERLSPQQLREAIKLYTEEQAYAVLKYKWQINARQEQLPPLDDLTWSFWLYLAGRGAGKTRAGVEFVRRLIFDYDYRRGALVARTAADVRDTLVEGESGVLNVFPPWQRPIYEPAKRRLFWPGKIISYYKGVAKNERNRILTTYSGDEPDQLRGPNHDFALADELAAWKRCDAAWSNLIFGLRLMTDNGLPPRCGVITTPRPIKIIKDLLQDESTILSKGTSYDNRDNLAPEFYKQIIKKYEGTRLGRQELLAEVLDDNPNALFSRDNLNKYRVRSMREVPDLERIAIAIDPPGSSDPEGDPAEAGIVGVGVDVNEEYYIICDYSHVGKPQSWATKAVYAYCMHEADFIAAEVNFGGDMVEAVVQNVEAFPDAGIEVSGRDIPFVKVRASRGKKKRAEPVSMLAEQGRLHIVGSYPELEDQMCQWSDDLGEESPDRLDAMVWAVTSLMKEGVPRIRTL